MLSKLKGAIRKTLLSDLPESSLEHRVLPNQWARFRQVWHNTIVPKSSAIGVERLLKLGLILLQFPFPGIYLRAISGRRGVLTKNLAVEGYVFFKICLAAFVLHFQVFGCFSDVWYKNPIAYLIIYMITESLLYTATLVFCNDVFAPPRSYKRNIILLLSDYFEVILDFGSLYLIAKALKHSCENCGAVSSSIDAAYFSFVTSVTIGYGDIIVSNDVGKYLVIFQTIIFLIYGVLFLNFYTSRIEEPSDLTGSTRFQE